MIHFWKMNGAGNDFVMLDNRTLRHSLSKAQIATLCDRHRGVGADGLLAVEPAQNGSDFRMRYYNADGGEAEMCGNGARCFARFANMLSGWNLQKVSFETPAGVIGATFHGDHVRILMSDPHSPRPGLKLDVAGQAMTVHFINTGVPHAVVVVDDLESVPVQQWGAALRYHNEFQPKGANANFMKVTPEGIAIRTYERGVEGETLACGTGMVACALVHHELTGAGSPVRVKVKGGDTLEIGFEKTADGYRNVTLTGPADLVFEGEVQLAP
ncbi:MAG TPA: diaminopimelate epimerase [Verrucomicrobiales bacterium]|nr:diaminopimelate epimerase [Verrucomicrobiales bacterium]